MTASDHRRDKFISVRGTLTKGTKHMSRVSKRVMKIQLETAELEVEKYLDLAEDQPRFQDKFLKQAIKADEDCQRLQEKLQ